MIVVSNTSPINNLAAVEQLYLLKALYGSIIIPEAVYRELTGYGTALPGCREVQTYDWIETREATDLALLKSLKNKLHEGEAEAIALAIELNADWVLIDENRGRSAANQYGVKFTGVLGILIKAKERGLIPLVKPVMDRLISEAGFWVNESLYFQILQLAGE